MKRSLIVWCLLPVIAASRAHAQSGACCRSDASCVNTDSAGCATLGGDFLEGRACADTNCMGACCESNKTCSESTRDQCTILSGEFQGPQTTCETHCPGVLTSAFLYQGQLKQDGLPTQGLVDLVFRMFDTAVGGDQVTPGVRVDAVEVVNGLFTVNLDFGPGVFSGNQRWLEVAVRSPHDPNDLAPFTTLAPRQPLTAAPYALALPGFRTTPNPGSPGVIGGAKENTTNSLNGATISGGGAPGAANVVTDMFGTVGGGASNQAGNGNNTINDRMFATVGGGELNLAGGAHSTVPGGKSNEAGGDFSFAAGRRAKATTQGSFVWADSTDADFASTANNQFLIRASGGVGIGTTSPGATLGISAPVASARLTSTGFNGPSLQLVQPDAGLTTGNIGTVAFSLGNVGATPSSRAEIVYANAVNKSLRFMFSTVSGLTVTSETMRILENGRVGIRTQTPANTLSVAGTADFSGNVGIGTDSPQATLDVNGLLLANEIHVAGIVVGTVMQCFDEANGGGHLTLKDNGNLQTVDLFATQSEGGAVTLRESTGTHNTVQLKGDFNGGGHLQLLEGDGTQGIITLVSNVQDSDEGPSILMRNSLAVDTVRLDADEANAAIMVLENSAGTATLVLDAQEGTTATGGRISVRNSTGRETVEIDADESGAAAMRLENSTLTTTINLTGSDGRVTCVDLVETSSRALKNDVTPIVNAMEKLNRLEGVSFQWDEDLGGRRDLGLIAEDVAEVLPELVRFADDGVTPTGINYTHLTAVIVEAIKQQQQQIQSLRAAKDAEIAELRADHERKLAQKDREIAALRSEKDSKMEKLEDRLSRLEELISTGQKGH